MSNVWGHKIKLTIFGESHGPGLGVVLSDLPAGILLDMEEIHFEMQRRAPGNHSFSTPRKEADAVTVMSGLFQGHTTGAPLCAMIQNTNTHSRDYEAIRWKARPGHADFTGYVKYSGFNDYRGGGHFSGRLTAGLVFAGAVAKQILRIRVPDLLIGAHIYQIRDICDDKFHATDISPVLLSRLQTSPFPLIDAENEAAMRSAIEEARTNLDSVGGIVECAIIGHPTGLGNPFFDSVESVLSHLLFSIPAVKGVEFGAGFAFAEMTGRGANDAFYYDEHKNVKTYTNNNAGLNGGISNGMPVVFRTAIKPTPSIASSQTTVDFGVEEDTTIAITGRHDPCIVPRAVPVIEAAAAVCILDLLCM